VRVAAPGLGGGLAQAGPYPPAPSAAPGYMVYMPVDEARVHTRVGVAGGLMLTLGILTLLWACLMVLYIFMLQAGMLDETVDPDIPREMVGAVFVVLGVLSAVSGGIELAAGIQLIRKRLAARTLGMAAAILGLCSLWTCCVWLFALGFGIYALAVLGPNRPA
jgi:hypothetical protein